MIRDNLVLFVLITFPVFAGGLAVLITLIVRRWSSTECPHCFLRIPKDALKYAVPCPECGAELAVTDPVDGTGESHNACRECNASSDCVLLWDGHTYCTTCISKHNPRLLELTGANQFVEEMSHSVGAVTWRMFLFASASVCGLGAIIAVPIAILAKWQEALEGLGVILLVGSPVIVLWTGAAAVAIRFTRLRVSAWNGQLIVQLGTRLIVAPLTECTWREGKLSQITVLNYAFLFRGPALIVELPQEVAQGGNSFAVGYTDDTRGLWQSFFELAGVPQAPPKQSWWSFRKYEKVN